MEILTEVRDLLNKTKIMLSQRTEEQTVSFGFVVEGVLLSLIAMFGVFGNLFCILSFSLKKNKNTFHHLMLGRTEYNSS